jgi:class 3 adenylate cyclase/tetratricopeptide (TPR) repeat protein
MSLICPSCQTANRDSARFCENCGAALPAACPNCGTLNRPGARFCDHCGERLATPPAGPAVGAPMAAGPPAASTSPASGRVAPRLHQFIPATLLAKLQDAQAGGGMVGERRVVTILFCDVKGSTAAAEQLDPEEWAEIMNGAFEYLIAPVYHYEGTLARMMGDAILAFFGAPIAHEDDPQRAVLAGLEIAQGLRPYREQIKARWGLDLDVRVGVNTGLVMVGPVGSDLHMEYTALGDAANVAARMEQTARPGTVQIASATYRLVAPLFEFEALGPLEIKGKAEPVLAYRALGARAAPGRLRGLAGHDAPLVGREAELGAMRRALEAAQAGKGRIICLLGEAGLGKSRLVRELRQDFEKGSHGAATGEGQWLEAASLSYEAGQPYGLFLRLLRAACSATENDPPETLRAKLDGLIALLPEENQASGALVCASLFRLSQAGQPESPQLEGESFRSQLFVLLPVLCRAWASQGPLALVFEDLHWADSASASLLEHLLPLVAEISLLVLYTLRPDEQAAGWRVKVAAEHDYSSRLTQLEVRPLSSAQSGELVDHLVPMGDLTPGLRERILARAEGNPLFVEEVVRALGESGALAAGSLAAGDASQFEIPDSLQSLLSARIDRLADETRRTLQMAAIVGRSFYYRVLAAILETGSELEARLGELQQANLIFEAARQPEREYSFRHALLHEAAYRTILRKHRREFHQRVGEALEVLFPAQLEQYAPALGFHFEEAGDMARALKYYALAGDAAYRLFANAEAESHYARALELAHRASASSETLLRLYTRCGRALELLSRHKEAIANYERLEAVGRQRAHPALELYGIAGQAQIRAMGATAEGDVAKAEALLARGLALAQSQGDQTAEARLEWTRLSLYHWTDQLPEARLAGERSLELARAAGLREQMAFTLQDLAYVYFASGDIERTLATNREAMGLWRQLRNQPMLTNTLGIEAMLHLASGEYDASLAASDEGYQLSAAIGNWWGMAFNRIIASLIHWDRGDPASAIAVGRDVIFQARRSGFIVPLFATPIVLAEVYADLGAVPEALALLRDVRGLQGPILPMYLPTLHAIELRVRLLNGQTAEALSIAAAHAGLLAELPSFYVRGTGYYLVGLAATVEAELGLLRGEPDLVIAMSQRFEAEAERTNRRALAEIFYWLGRAQFAAGDHESANAALHAARQQAEAVGQQRVLWSILALQAELAAQAGDTAQAEALLTQARAIIAAIADRAGSPELRASFLARPAVRAIWP